MARRTLALLVLIALALAAGATWLWLLEKPVERGARAPDAVDGASSTGSAELEREPPSVAARSHPLPEISACVAGEDELCVTVVDARSGRIVTGAQVWWVDEDRLARALADPVARLSRDPEQLYFQHGSEHVADERGHARVPRSEQRCIVYCRVEDRGAKLRIAPNETEPQRLELGPAGDLHVRAVDLEGRGVGAVSFVLHSSLHGDIKFASGVSSYTDGRVILGSGSRYIVATPEEEVLTLRCATALDDPVRVDGPNDESRPLTVRVAEPSSLEVRVVLPFGDAARVRGTVELRHTKRELDPEATRFALGDHRLENPRSRGILVRETDSRMELDSSGRALFRPIPLGGSFQVLVFLEEPQLELLTYRQGTNRARERLDVVLPDATTCIVRARILGGSEQGGGERPTRALTWCDAGRPVRSHEFDPSRGELLFAVDARPNYKAPRSLAVVDVIDGSVGEPRMRMLALPEVRPAVLDLGEFALSPAPIVLAGRVVDPSGRPVSGVLVAARHGEGYQIFRRGGSGLFEDVLTDNDGRFAIRGCALCDRIVLEEPAGARTSSAELRFDVGTQDVELIVPRGGEVLGSVGLDVMSLLENQAGPIVVHLRDEKSMREGGRAIVEADGSFHVRHAAEGTYSLHVDSWPLLEDVVVRVGAVTNDARLQSISLGGPRLRPK